MNKRYLRIAVIAATMFSTLYGPAVTQAGAQDDGKQVRAASKSDEDARTALRAAAARPSDQLPERIGAPVAMATQSCGPLDEALDTAKARGNDSVICVTPLEPSTPMPKRELSHQSIQPLPDWCYDHAFDGWWATRNRMCMIDGWRIVVSRVVNGVPTAIGGFDYNEFNYAYTSSTLTNWAHQIEIGMFNPWGDTAGIQVTGGSSCTGACSNGGANFPSQPVLAGTYPGGDAYFQSTAVSRGSEGRAATKMSYYFTKPNATPSGLINVETPDVRCDHKLPGNNTVAGCIVYGTVSVINYSLTTPYPELAAHIRDAQATGIPGAPGSGAPLHRLIDPAKQQLNRDVACPASLPRPPGKSCDEYPMASTWEGAATGVNNYSTRMIDELQNSNGGNAMNTFYRDMRLLDFDAFYVGIVP